MEQNSNLFHVKKKKEKQTKTKEKEKLCVFYRFLHLPLNSFLSLLLTYSCAVFSSSSSALASSAGWTKLHKDLEETRKAFQEMSTEEKLRRIRLLRQLAECDASIELIPVSSSSS